jgi:hypothetical protein
MLAESLALALDKVRFAEAVGFNPDPWQVRVLRWSGRRLILNCSRQAGKSTVSSLLAVHRAVYYPGSLILLVSPSLRQSSELFKRVSDWLQKIPKPPHLPEDNKLSCTLHNGSRIVSLPSNEATVRGFSEVDLIIEDEASRVNDDLNHAMRPMLAVSNGRIILMSTPFGMQGHFYKTWEEDDPSWEKILVDVYQNPRITPDFIESERRTLPDRVFRQEYLCEFCENEDAVFSLADFDRGVTPDVKPLFGGLRP